LSSSLAEGTGEGGDELENRIALVAIGGNSLIKDKKRQSVEDQYEAARETCQYVADLIEDGWSVIITHGNGPQVGFVLLRSEMARSVLHTLPLELCGADTQGGIGYHLQQNLANELRARGIRRPVATVLTQTVVDHHDPSFSRPDKPIGPFYTQEEALVHQREDGWVMVEDSGRGWRRVVPSPRPKRIVELEVIGALLKEGVAVIALGGGGIPVIEHRGKLTGVAAVIDKDRASALLAVKLKVSHLVISTAVEKVYLDFGTPRQRAVDVMTVEEAESYLAEGHFKAGWVRPKIEASLDFLRGGGTEVVISTPENLRSAIRGTAGTRIVHGR